MVTFLRARGAETLQRSGWKAARLREEEAVLGANLDSMVGEERRGMNEGNEGEQKVVWLDG